MIVYRRKHDSLLGNPFITVLNPPIAIRKAHILGFNMMVYRMIYDVFIDIFSFLLYSICNPINRRCVNNAFRKHQSIHQSQPRDPDTR